MTTHLHETLRGGQAWSRRLARHQRLRLTDVEGRACVSALFYNARDPHRALQHARHAEGAVHRAS